MITCPSSWAIEIEIDGELFEVNRINQHVVIASQAFGTTRINFGIVVGSDEVVLISSMMRRNAQSVEELVRHVSGKPITKVLVIDSDPFHHHGSSYFRDRGATIIGHENLTTQGVTIDISFSEELLIDAGTETIRMTHSAAHTLDHAFITLEKSNVVFAGDALRNDWLIYAGPNGWPAHISALREIAFEQADSTIFVPSNRGQKVSTSAAELNKIIGIYEGFSELSQKLAHEGLSANAIADHQDIKSLLQGLERYDEFVTYTIHHVEDVFRSGL
ncbi:hypothetical protein CWE22_07560 [Pseudidiomarina aestuarii]|uniref:Metallo-beta-lactamase domain-containing protein n=2 Tax=Pseudidiomarina aestuarii TaxID=624146 RepID=A0A7Z6ZV60_9GAMM|nr:hypothetical protein CWE22_07560 [Pseudidiomarina aestuarii]